MSSLLYQNHVLIKFVTNTFYLTLHFHFIERFCMLLIFPAAILLLLIRDFLKEKESILIIYPMISNAKMMYLWHFTF